ncbi:iron ABC transporter substrate-binding protein [Litorilinea aerophila]|nr:iron ABC transporter substrate-binding protein [Litorilinea aerophila]MCC9075197.1 iron ABC transporter substrate-binding protein [Litorilinea aerophila]GIV78330.1 MAG: iron ABC transporter substrate-binding protein [Litorilinea sp.]
MKAFKWAGTEARRRAGWVLSALLLVAMVAACAPVQPAAPGEAAPAADAGSLVIYSGRSENLVQPIIDRFAESTGIQVEVRYGSTPEVAATLLEEGANSPADVFFAQDPGGLGAVMNAGLLADLPEEILNRVKPRFRSPAGKWVGVSGRARVVVYNTEMLTEADLPADIWDFVDPQWAGRIGWAPTNASFQAMVTAMRVAWGEEKTRQWLEGILANDPVVFEGNSPIVAAVGAGEIEVGFVNHYYLYRFLREEGEDFKARNYFLPGGGPGSLVMVAGVGQLAAARNPENAQKFIEFLVSPEAQQYFTEQTYEYPVIDDVPPPEGLVPLEELNAIDIDLADLADLQGTTRLLSEVGVLP